MKAYMYETMYILRPDLNDEIVDGLIAKYQALLQEQGASILETQHRGKRRLAYDIDRHREGIYIQMNYSGSGGAVAPLERAMRLSDEVIRFLTVKQEADPALVPLPTFSPGLVPESPSAEESTAVVASEEE
ncbi:MAG: 30S ribosomal protein S6 [Cyanobacteriota bacterium]|jgi:small subunit ribosomal protein S6|nr:30S ribosomal protein S6 [Cyanobacteriota bacterium]